MIIDVENRGIQDWNSGDLGVIEPACAVFAIARYCSCTFTRLNFLEKDHFLVIQYNTSLSIQNIVVISGMLASSLADSASSRRPASDRARS